MADPARGGIVSNLRGALASAGRGPGAAPAYRGNVDGRQGGAVIGWVVRGPEAEGALPVGLFAGEGLVASAVADRERADVRAAGIGDGRSGFEFRLDPATRDRIPADTDRLVVRVLDDSRHPVGGVALDPAGAADEGLGAAQLAACRGLLFGDLHRLQRRLEAVGADEAAAAARLRAPALSAHAALFRVGGVLPPELPESGQPAYLDYVRHHAKLDERFDVGPGLEAGDHFLHWYLTRLHAEAPRRLPLGREQIAHLNAPVVMGGQAHALSRFMWWRLLERPGGLQGLDLNDRESHLGLLYWWAGTEAPRLGVEDCLVPERVAALLRAVRPSRRDERFPLSHFLEHLHRDAPQLGFADPATESGRRLLMLCVMVMAAERPDLLRYVPRASVAALLARRDGRPSGFEAFLGELAHGAPPEVPEWRYAAALRLAGYDLHRRTFLTLTPAGDRLAAAALPAPGPERGAVDVQIIGPLAKSSGLGQAARLSAEILRRTGLRVRGVDFGLDNPTPEGFSTASRTEPPGPARVNLLHLNAELVPQAFAYHPDVFSGAYNIGYVYWELDRPAHCHYLGMELLDEIWVSSAHGVEIYRPEAGGRPVTNVGMSYEPPPEIDRGAARARLRRRFGFAAGDHVCLVTFDSFSFVQRKNPLGVLRAFQAAFADRPDARLVVKTQNRDGVTDPAQARIWARIAAMAEADPRIVLLDETLDYRDLLELKAGADCYVSLHRAEGWGFGMIEAMALGVPVVCSAYSGNLEFCTKETAWLVACDETLLGPGDYIFVRKGARWAEPDLADAARQLRAVFDDPEAARARAGAARAFVETRFSIDAVAARYGARLREILEQEAPMTAQQSR